MPQNNENYDGNYCNTGGCCGGNNVYYVPGPQGKMGRTGPTGATSTANSIYIAADEILNIASQDVTFFFTTRGNRAY